MTFGDEDISAVARVNDLNIDYADANNKAIEIGVANTTIIYTYEVSRHLYIDQIVVDIHYPDLEIHSYLIRISKFFETQTQETFTFANPLNNFTLEETQIVTEVYKLVFGLHYVVNKVLRSTTNFSMSRLLSIH